MGRKQGKKAAKGKSQKVVMKLVGEFTYEVSVRVDIMDEDWRINAYNAAVEKLPGGKGMFYDVQDEEVVDGPEE